jgi:hypothetical protein
LDTPTYTVTITIGGSSQTTSSKIGSVLPSTIITKQSGQLIVTAVDAAGDPFDLSSLTGTECYIKPWNTSVTPVSLGTGVISGAGNNVYTVTWTSDTIPAGWSSYADDKDGAIVLYITMDETGTADYYQWNTRLNVNDGDYTGDASTTPLVSLVYYFGSIYEYDDTTTDADPGAGKFRMDNTTLSSVTELYVADDNKSSVDMQTYWQSLISGDHLYLSNPNVSTDAAYFTVSGAPTNNTGYTTVPVTYVDAGTTSFTDGTFISLSNDISGLSNSFADGSSLNDNNGNELLEFGVTGSAVNHTKTTNAATGSGPTLASTGDDANVDFNIDTKGSGTINLNAQVAMGGKLDMNSQQLELQKGADVASAGALTLGTDGNYFDITGTTTITSIGTLGIGTVVTLHFDGALTLTHNATDLVLPGGANITTAAGDEFTFVEYASGDWRCIGYVLASGEAIVGGGGGILPATDSTDLTSAHTVVAGDINETHPIGSATTADFDITFDVSLLTTTSDTIGFKNESSYIARVVVSNTSTMTLNSQYTDRYISPGQTVVFQGDTSTNAVIATSV